MPLINNCADGLVPPALRSVALVGGGTGWRWRWSEVALVGGGTGPRWRWSGLALVWSGWGECVAAESSLRRLSGQRLSLLTQPMGVTMGVTQEPAPTPPHTPQCS